MAVPETALTSTSGSSSTGDLLDEAARFETALRNSAQIRIGTGLPGSAPVRKAGPDLGLDSGWIDVARDDQGRALRPVISAVKVDEQLARGGPDDVRVTDVETLGDELSLREEL